MARGIIHGAMSGLGEGLIVAGKIYGDYLSRSQMLKEAEEAQRLRDERLEEFAKAREQRGYQQSREMVEHTEDVRSRRAIEAGKAAEASAGAMVDDLSGTMRTPTAAEQASARSTALRSRGFISEAMAVEGGQREQEARTEDRMLRREEGERRERQDQRQHAERMTALNRQLTQQGEQIRIEKDKLQLLQDTGALDLKQKRAIDQAREAYVAETDPEKKHEKGATYLTLLGKVGERYKAITEKDHMGNEVTVGFFDTLSGKEIVRRRQGAGVQGGERPPLESFAGKSRPTQAGVASGAQIPPSTKSGYEQFVKLRRGGYYIDAPPRSPAAALNGKTGSREELLRALSALEAYAE